MGSKDKILNFSKGEKIFGVGDKANCAYIVDYGTVGLYPITNQDEF